MEKFEKKNTKGYIAQLVTLAPKNHHFTKASEILREGRFFQNYFCKIELTVFRFTELVKLWKQLRLLFNFI